MADTLQSLINNSGGAQSGGLSSNQQTILASVINYFSKSDNSRYTTDRMPQIVPFVNNSNNYYGLLAAWNVYGNPASLQHYEQQAEWYYFAYYANLYPTPAASQQNCSVLYAQETSLQAELAGSDKIYVSDNDATLHNIRTKVINTLLSNVQSLYANLNCDTYVVQTQNSTDQAAQLAQVAAVTTGSATSNIGLYFLVGTGLIVAFLVVRKIIKHKSK